MIKNANFIFTQSYIFIYAQVQIISRNTEMPEDTIVICSR